MLFGWFTVLFCSLFFLCFFFVCLFLFVSFFYTCVDSVGFRPGVIPKTQKWYLMTPCLTLSIIR